MLFLSSRARTDLERWASQGYPHETCGVLVGENLDDAVRVERAVRGRNLAVERARERYELDPGDFVAADLAARAAGRSIVGIWHSHPDHPAEPSETDRAAAWKGWSFLILAVGAAGVGAVRSWRLVRERFEEEELVVESGVAALQGHSAP